MAEFPLFVRRFQPGQLIDKPESEHIRALLLPLSLSHDLKPSDEPLHIISNSLDIVIVVLVISFQDKSIAVPSFAANAHASASKRKSILVPLHSIVIFSMIPLPPSVLID